MYTCLSINDKYKHAYSETQKFQETSVRSLLVSYVFDDVHFLCFGENAIFAHLSISLKEVYTKQFRMCFHSTLGDNLPATLLNNYNAY